MIKLIKKIPKQVILFLFVFSILASFVHTNSIVHYFRSFMGAEAIVERGHFYVDGSKNRKYFSDASTPTSDFFIFNGHTYSNKQPGLSFINAIPYYFLHQLNFNFIDDFIFCGAFISLFTSVLMLALMSVFIFNIFFHITKKQKQSFIYTLIFCFGTLLFPYAGVSHHDIYATFFVFSGLYLLFYNFRMSKEVCSKQIFIAGLLIAFSLFSSCNSWVMCLFTAIYVASFKNLKYFLFYSIGAIVGLLPTFILNYIVFGDPKSFSYILDIAYHPVLTKRGMFKFSVERLLTKLFSYFLSPKTSITFYFPIYLVSILGYVFIPKKYTNEKIIFPLACIFQILYFCNFYYVGWCMYGPRYLIESIPFALIGLSGFSYLNKQSALFKPLKTIFLITSIFSVFVCTVGSLWGTMNCVYHKYALVHYLEKLLNSPLPKYVFLVQGSILFVITTGIFLVKRFSTFSQIKNYLFDFHEQYGKKWCYLLIVLLLGLFLRVFLLEKIPFGIYVDEGSVGYNAFSISETGKDEYGTSWPLYFSAFGEFKNPVIIYLAALIIKIFGASVFSLRLGSALCGLIGIFYTYKLANLYFGKGVGLLSALLLAVSPWHLQFSRIAIEPISFSGFFIMAIYYFASGILNQNKWRVVLSSIPIAVTFYTYALGKSFLPILLVVFILINFKQSWKLKKEIFVMSILLITMLIPIYERSLHSNIHWRPKYLSITSEKYLQNAYRGYKFLEKPIFNLVPLKISGIFIANYFKHMSLDFLFFNGDNNLRQNCSKKGQLHKFIFIFLIIGMVFILFEKTFKNLIFPAWFFLFPVVVSMTWDALPHAGRSINGLPCFHILAAYGIFSSFYLAKRIFARQKIAGIFIYLVVLMLSIFGLNEVCSQLNYYFKKFAVDARYNFNFNDYCIVNSIKGLRNYKKVFIPYSSQIVNFLYLENYPPRLRHSDLKKHVEPKYIFNARNLNDKDLHGAIRIKYFNKSGNERKIGVVRCELTNENLFDIVIPVKSFNHPVENYKPKLTGGLLGSYYDGRHSKQLIFKRVDKEIKFNWKKSTPNKNINKNNFTVVWKGLIFFPESGEYNFISRSDDGCRLFLDDILIIDDWKMHVPLDNKVPLKVKKGWHKVQFEYFESGGEAEVGLYLNRGNRDVRTSIKEYLLSPDIN